MLFHTWDFVLFFLVVYAVYLPIRRWNTPMLHWLLGASYYFYGRWNWYYLALIVFCTLLDWFIGLRLGASPRKRLWLTISLLSNLGFLASFKYADFFTANLNALFAQLGWAVTVRNPVEQAMQSLGMKYLLPVGISFFTFQSMSYTIDVYRGKIPVERSLLRFATFVSLFPQLVAGPIERASNLLPQLCGRPPVSLRDVTDGLSHFLVGLFKKVALADYLAHYVDRVYGSPADQSSLALALATFAFAWQIYFDFSGYTDMARGVGLMMGFRLMLNFNNPYVATGLGDFWNRWHISLSSWFKDYVYFPLGGNRGGTWFTYRNMFLTMLVSGFWHGAAWTFLAWGALHALGRVLTRELEQSEFYRDRVPKLFKQAWVFAFVCLTWVFFRARSLEEAWLILTRIFSLVAGDPQVPALMLALVVAVFLYQFLYSGNAALKRALEAPAVRFSAAAFMMLYLAIVAQPSTQAFIYFQF